MKNVRQTRQQTRDSSFPPPHLSLTSFFSLSLFRQASLHSHNGVEGEKREGERESGQGECERLKEGRRDKLRGRREREKGGEGRMVRSEGETG